MISSNRNDLLTREAILKRLSDNEVEQVSMAETAASLTAGDEYLDLEQLERGVLTAGATPPAMGRVLPRKAVAEATWRWILKDLAGLAAPAALKS